MNSSSSTEKRKASPFLADLFARCGRRRVWVVNDRGRGGVIGAPDDKRSDGWRTFADEWTLACIEGEPWVRLPPVPATAFLEG